MRIPCRASITGCLVLSQFVFLQAKAVDPPRLTAVTVKPAIHADHMRPHIEFLAGPNLKGRGDAEAKQEAREYIIDQMIAAQLKPLFLKTPAGVLPSIQPSTESSNPLSAVDACVQLIPDASDANGIEATLGHNVGFWLEGSDSRLAKEFVIVSAHYDHLGVREGQIFTGADDNASGVAMVLEVARQLASSDTKPKRSVAFVAFDLEERLLWGSRWFAAHPPWPLHRVKLLITADMIGRSLGNLPLPTVFAMGSEHARELKVALDQVGTPVGLEVCRLGTDLIGTRSDYGPFRDRSIPYLFFSTGEHPDYHTPQDTPEKIDYDKAAGIASLILNLTRYVADSDRAPVWIDAIPGDLDEPRALNRISTLLLETEKERSLTNTQRFLITNVRNRTQRILKNQWMTPDDRIWLIRTSQLLLLSVF